MRIGFDAKRLFRNYTGLGNYSRSVISGLLKYFPENDYCLYTTDKIINTETEKIVNHPSIKVVQTAGPFKSIWRTFGISRKLEENEIQLYHGLSNEIPVGLQKRKIRSIVTIHDLIFKIHPETYPIVDRKIYDLKFRYACKNADQIIATSANTKADIMMHYKVSSEKIKVVYQSANSLFYQLQDEFAVNKTVKALNLPSEYLLYTGSVTERKNLLTLMQAYEIIPSGKRIPLVVVGKGSAYKAKILHYIHDKGFEKNIIWLENISDNYQLQAIYQKASLFIYPSFYEGFGIPVIEALLSNIPVIAANSSSLPEAGGPGSVYFDPNNPGELADKIIKVLTDNELRTEMIRKGNKYANLLFSLETTSKQIMSIYRHI